MIKKPKAWERVKIARMIERPTALDYINEILTNFIELHGDRNFKDDEAVVGGIALLDEMPVTVIGIQKGKNLKENIKRNQVKLMLQMNFLPVKISLRKSTQYFS